ncbi:tetratricopeptide repeat protein, partial [Treponema sp. OttesenSCG-928-L16]|nr:tetratricopeptide repeat protein [Treponema sp. OttesenSCG-928-L16]
MTFQGSLVCRAALFLLLAGIAAPLTAQNTFLPDAAYYYREGRSCMDAEDYYSAAEAFLECVRLNPAHAEANACLAECYYGMGEFDQAYSWIRRARNYARGNMALANLEASILIALGNLDAASSVIAEVLTREPYNREALFTAAELDIARGRSSDAVLRYREAARRYPDDRRLLLSLALVLGSMGDMDNAKTYIDRALRQHSGDYRVYYYAAYLDSLAGRFSSAIRYAEQALAYRPAYAPARRLLASLKYRSGEYTEAARLADEAIAADREDISAWYLKGLSFIRMDRYADAIGVLSIAATIDAEDEFVRTALEDALIQSTSLEDPSRQRWASWHFAQGRDYRSRNLMDQALFEFRRGLRLNPYANERREYAQLLKLQGYPSRYAEELHFMQELGMSDRDMDDAAEAYDSLLADSLYRRWSVEALELANRYWKLAVFSVASQSAFYHTDAGNVGSAYIRDLLVHSRNIQPMELELRQSSYSSAFRSAREAGADYFLIISISESERDISVKGELFVGRTGSPAGVFHAYRTGADRLRNASRNIIDQLVQSLPFRAQLIRRRASQGLIDKGRADGVEANMVCDVVKAGRTLVRSEGIGLDYRSEDVVGTFTV